MDRERFRAVLDEAMRAGGLPDRWVSSGSGFGLVCRPRIGISIIELDYDYPAHRGDCPRWVCNVWRSLTALESGSHDGIIATVFADIVPPSGMGDDDYHRLAAFAVGVVRLAPAVETIVCGG